MHLGTKKGGYDVARDYIICMIVALTLNLPYNFSRLIFKQMKGNLTSDRWLMYLRFMQMLLDDFLPNLEKYKSGLLPLEHMNNLSLDQINTYKNQAEEDILKFKKLIGFLGNGNYIAPPKDRWRKDGSNSDKEDQKLEGSKEKRSRWFVKEEKLKKSKKHTKRNRVVKTMLRDEDSEDDLISATSEKDTSEIAQDIQDKVLQRGLVMRLMVEQQRVIVILRLR
ncbi:hypothetical protein Hdeb2414_s0005g00157831 [Helianthus debilis subsp. tardiflorus]